MAGFGTIFGEAIHDAFPDRILNTHPALLPVVQGLARACATRSTYGVKVTGCTVHVATLEVDAGPILAQEAVAGAARRRRGVAPRAHQGRRAPALPRDHPGGPRRPGAPHQNEVTDR